MVSKYFNDVNPMHKEIAKTVKSKNAPVKTMPKPAKKCK